MRFGIFVKDWVALRDGSSEPSGLFRTEQETRRLFLESEERGVQHQIQTS
jgi:hypothetical protein